MNNELQNSVSEEVSPSTVPVTSVGTTPSVTPIVDNKKKKKKKHRFLKFLLFVLIFILLIKGILYAKDMIQEKKYENFIKSQTHVMTNEEIKLTKEEYELDSNMDGMTNKEKIDLGLDIMSEDTDGDGLTDYDEVHKYNSDPTKFSTAGDLVSDYYKVNHQLNVQEKSQIVPDIKVSNERITLTPKKAEDVLAYYKEYDGAIPSGYTLGMKPFRIYSFQGEASIQIEHPEYYKVYSYNTVDDNVTKLKSKKDKDTITFTIKDNNPILISFDEKVLKKLNENVQSSVVLQDFGNPVNSEYIIVAVPFFNVFFKVPVLIFQINDHNHYLENKYNTPESKINVSVQYIGSQEADVLDFFFQGFIHKLSEENGISTNDNFFQYFFLYRHIYGSNDLYHFLDLEENEEETAEEKPLEEKPKVEYEFEEKYLNTDCKYCADSGFDVSKNAFRFNNLTTNESNGVCMGFAHVTTNTFGHHSLDKSNRTYNLTDSVFNDIWEGNLFNYVPATEELALYADDIRNNEDVIDIATLDYPDGEVVKLLDYYYDKINNKVRMKKFSWAWNNSFSDKKTPISSTAVDEMINRFKNHDIVSIVLLGSGQHAVNAYKIVEDKNDKDILYLKIYDNNFAQDKFWNTKGEYKKYDITITLYRQYETTVFGNEKTYYYFKYDPFNNDSYRYENVGEGRDALLILNENGNVIS